MQPSPKQLSPIHARSSRCALLTIVTLALVAQGCASAPVPSPVPCSRVELEPSPPWTASAAWTRGEDAMVLIDPGSRGLATYDRNGQRRSEVELAGTSDINYSEPMRFERTDEGYVLIGKTHVLSLDDSLALQRREKPFASLTDAGVIDGTFNDMVLHRGALYGYADFIDTSEAPADDPEAGTWRRGFVRLDASRGELDVLHEMAIDSADGEYASYYFYDRRPYVVELDGKVYVLRFTEPWSIHRVTRRGGLREVAVGQAGIEQDAHAIQAWNGQLYLLTSRLVPQENEEPDVQPARPISSQVVGTTAKIELEKARRMVHGVQREWMLHEIDPRRGSSRRMVLPSTAERLRLIPGRGYWTAIEESSAPKVGESGGTSFLYLPATEILAGGFSCGAELRRDVVHSARNSDTGSTRIARSVGE